LSSSQRCSVQRRTCGSPRRTREYAPFSSLMSASFLVGTPFIYHNPTALHEIPGD
jgi:hypothetical protein